MRRAVRLLALVAVCGAVSGAVSLVASFQTFSSPAWQPGRPHWRSGPHTQPRGRQLERFGARVERIVKRSEGK